MKTITLLSASLLLLTTLQISAQVAVTEKESSNKSSSQSAISISTSDRDIVPLIIETKKQDIGANKQKTESVTRARLNDGTYFDWKTSNTVKEQESPTVTKISTQVVEKDRQGRERTQRSISETVTKTDSGEQKNAVVYTRNSSGNLVLNNEVNATTTKQPDGTVKTVTMEKVADVNGRLIPKEQTEEVVKEPSANEQLIVRTTKSYDHLNGDFAVSAEETTRVRTEGAQTQIESIVRKPTRTGFAVDAKINTKETRAPDGTVQRETIESSRSLYSKYTGESTEALVPQRKIVEREVRKPDGTIVLQRDVYRRDVNGEWKPQTFSTVSDIR